MSIYGAVGDNALGGLGTEQLPQFLSNSLAPHWLCKADKRVNDLFDDGVMNLSCSLVYINAGAYIKVLVSSNQESMNKWTSISSI